MSRLLLWFWTTCFVVAQPAYFTNRVHIGNASGADPEICHTQLCADRNPGAEVLLDHFPDVTGCGGMYSMSINGSTPISLMPPLIGIPDASTHASGNPRYSPDGRFMLFQMQDSHTGLSCHAAGAGPGGGFGNGLFVRNVLTNVVTELAVQGDNTGHHCAPAAICQVLVPLVPYVNDGHGVLHWNLTADGAHVYGSYVMGTNSGQQVPLKGTFRWCAINLTGATPTITNCAETDVPPGDGTGNFNWYEGAGFLPTDPCVIYATTGTQLNGSALHTSILRYNTCTGNYSIVTPDGCYSEFAAIHPRGIFAIASSSCKDPNPSLFNFNQPIIGPLDLVMFNAATGAGLIPITLYNSPGTVGETQYTISHGSWDWTGNYFIANVVVPGVASFLYRWNFAGPAPPGILTVTTN